MIHIERGSRVAGDIATSGAVVLDGRLDGSIAATRLEVGADGYLVGEIRVDELIVAGQVLGGVFARKVTVRSTALIEGDITHVLLALEEGAILMGDCVHVRTLDLPAPVRALRAQASAEEQSLATLERLSREQPGSARVRVVRASAAGPARGRAGWPRI